MAIDGQRRVLSGMRPTGRLHLGHYHGVLKNWLKLQHEYECFFFVADWHALTTDYDSSKEIDGNTWDMIIDWLAVGINPGSAKLFIQSQVPEHAELFVLLSMITPLSWLERVPSYKDQQEKLSNKDLTTYGFLGYPLLQIADILIYKAEYVPVGHDQVAHVELAREVARRFNYLYGREDDFAEKSEAAIKKMGKKNGKLYSDLRKAFQEQGDAQAIEQARALLSSQKNISVGDRERLFGYIEGDNKLIFPEPIELLTPVSKMMGLDGQKMSKSYDNAITLRDDPSIIQDKIKTMPTDPARKRRNDAGDPNKCPVWGLHTVYTDDETQAWVQEGCRSAKIGCVDCKAKLIDAVIADQQPIRERAEEYKKDPETVRGIIDDGVKTARVIANETLEQVRQIIGINYS